MRRANSCVWPWCISDLFSSSHHSTKHCILIYKCMVFGERMSLMACNPLPVCGAAGAVVTFQLRLRYLTFQPRQNLGVVEEKRGERLYRKVVTSLS